MKLVGLTAYGLKIRNMDNQNIELHNIKGWDLIDYLETIAQQDIHNYNNDEVSDNVFGFNEVISETKKNDAGQDIYKALYVRIKTGEYGEESEIVDKNTGEVKYTKSAEEANVMPFGCCIIIPVGEYTEGIILLQSLGRNGISTIIKKKINEEIKRIDPTLRLVMHSIIPKEYMDRFLKNGMLKTVRFIQYGIENDDAERYGINRGTKEVIQERVIRKPTGFIENNYHKLVNCMNGDITYSEIVQLEDFEIDDLKLEFQIGKRVKTISMKGLDRIVFNEDITEDVIMKNGHPIFESLCSIMRETGESYLRIRGLME